MVWYCFLKMLVKLQNWSKKLVELKFAVNYTKWSKKVINGWKNLKLLRDSNLSLWPDDHQAMVYHNIHA